MSKKAYDIVLWGATGFTGQLVAEYFAKTVAVKYPALKWALAARSEQKLSKVRDDLGIKNDMLIGSSSDQDSIDNIVSQARVVLSTVGPFLTHGTPVVDACVRYGSDYVDITGEVPWVRQLLDKYDDDAKKNNTYIVNCCGFDSIPSDLGSLYTAQQLMSRSNTKTKQIHAYAAMAGALSGGTLASGIAIENDPVTAKAAKDPFLLGGKPPSGEVRAIDTDVTDAKFSDDIQAWTGPFMMAGINTRIVRRSKDLLENAGKSPYTTDFGYNEVAAVPHEKGAQKLARGVPPASKRQEMVNKGVLPKPGEGPSKEQRDKAWFKFLLVAEGENGSKLVGKVSGGDPGYGETSKMLSEAALTLALDKESLPGHGGVVTPAAAMGNVLIDRLVAEGIDFSVDEDLTLKLNAGQSKL